MGCSPGGVICNCCSNSSCFHRQKYAGMLLGGISPLVGLAVVLLIIAATFVANILAGMIALLMLSRQDKNLPLTESTEKKHTNKPIQQTKK